MFHALVSIKQVPDTTNIRIDPETNNLIRQGVPTILNPYDAHAVAAAVEWKRKLGGKVTIITMGPPAAVTSLRECIEMGADRAILISARQFAGADTLATSYVLAEVIKEIHSKDPIDLVFFGKQAIDGDTAQVGPQVAEKLGVPQITYAEAILSLEEEQIVVRRAFEHGMEIVQCSLPCLLTVVSTANQPRPASVRRRIQYKLAAVPSEVPGLLEKWPEFGTAAALEDYLAENNLKITVWTTEDLEVDESLLGLSGSPTQVYKVNFVVLEATESKEIPPTEEGIRALIQELIQEYLIG